MQGNRRVLVLSLTFLSHLPWMADYLPNEPIKSRGLLEEVGKELDRTGAKTLRKLWPGSVVASAWRMDGNYRLRGNSILAWVELPTVGRRRGASLAEGSTTGGRRPDSFRR